MQKQLTFYFDYISPYAFLAWRKIGPLCNKYNIALKAEPVVFGALLSHWESKGPAEIQPKRLFTFKDIQRWAASDKIEIKFPPVHPYNPLLALRSTCLMENADNYNEYISALFNTSWEEGKDMSSREVMLELFERFGIENGIEKCASDAIKLTLRNKTEAAIAKGVFGVPSMLIDDEIFWGNDRFNFLENYLKGEDTVNYGILEDFLNRPYGVRRK